MIYHKTLLISCHIADSPQAMPLATSILKSYLWENENIQIKQKDSFVNDSVDALYRFIIQEQPDSVGFSMYIWNRVFFDELARLIKNENKDIIIYTGGAEVTASAESFLDNKHYDYLIRGEGEIPFARLMDFLTKKSVETLPKILFQQHIKDLNTLKSPFLNGIINPDSRKGILWELSRGCPYNCAFCSESRGVDGVRYYNESRIREELVLFEKKCVEQIFVLDPTFNTNKKRALKILSLIKECAPSIHYTFEIRAELLDEQLAMAFSELHCSLQIGLQSCHDHVLRTLNRSINKDIFAQKISLLNQNGAVFGLDLIYGLPGDTLSGFLESLDYGINLIPNHLDIFRLSIFPGTELYEKSNGFEINFLPIAPYSVIKTPTYTESDLLISEKIAESVDLFYNKGRSAPWLLPLLHSLSLKASEFFVQFTQFTEGNYFDNIQYSQIKFIEYLYDNHSTNEMVVAKDLCLFHHLYSEALYAEDNSPQSSDELKDILQGVFQRNNLLKLGVFQYDCTIYSELAMFDFNSFIEEFEAEVSYALLFNNGEEIATMGVERFMYNFISSLDGLKTVEEIIDFLGIKLEEIFDILEFLVESRLIFSPTL